LSTLASFPAPEPERLTASSELVGSKGLASEMLSGKRGITKSQALKLSERFHVPAAVFLGL
jgi:antitoxin component HigA of HigAB toxin-antitoxin module